MMGGVYPWLHQVASALDGEDWLLVGGAMTQLHCALSHVGYGRTTEDVDIVVDPITNSTLVGVAEALERAGYEQITPLRREGFLHQFRHEEGSQVDVMGIDSDRTPDRWRGYNVVKCPGSKSALGRLASGTPKDVLEVPVSEAHTVRLPNAWSALAMKGHALQLPDANRERHVQDALALLACAHRTEVKRGLTKSEHSGVNKILSSSHLSEVENWMPLDQTHWGEALEEIRRLRPQGEIGVPEPLKPMLLPPKL